MTDDTVLILVPLTAYAGKDDGHDWQYGLYIDDEDLDEARRFLEQATAEQPDE